MTELWEKFSTDCLLLIDASNAFNRLKRVPAQWNIRFICPPLGIILINLYRRPARLFILGGYELSSQEGVTQGCPFAMAMYALATLPLLNLLRPLLNRDKREWMPRPDLAGGGTEDKSQGDKPTQVWFADDGQGGGSLKQVRTLWDRVQRFGPGFGYYPKPKKTILIVKEDKENAAKTLFKDSKVKVTKEGHRDLGAFIGTKLATSGFFADKIQSWTRQISLLAKIAKTQPHAAHASYLHGLRSKWVFLQRVMAAIGTELGPVEKAINEKLIPAILGKASAASKLHRDLFALPGRYSGLGFDNPTNTASHHFRTSQLISKQHAELILTNQRELKLNQGEQKMLKEQLKEERELALELEYRRIFLAADTKRKEPPR
jgi:hypothetical protein